MVYAKNRNSDVVGHLTPSSFGYSVHYKTFKNGEYTRCKTLGMSVKELIENWIIIENYKYLYEIVKGFKKNERIRVWYKSDESNYIESINCVFTGELRKSGFISRDGEVWSETKDNRNMIRNHEMVVDLHGIEKSFSLMAYVVYAESLDNVPSMIPLDVNVNDGAKPKLPDIDSDFAEVDANKVIKYIKEKYPVSV
ncbi:hypothetical protein [Bacillus cereus]|uniref:hypothetical protein n=1 Tax=Bacillus cereus TaxID=1396 RepID=UPI000BF7A294|nr:hypothetical protein [Bacillus cereus]PFQ27731.1 hypothetical protein COK33_31525 [Bacillus cereus]